MTKYMQRISSIPSDLGVDISQYIAKETAVVAGQFIWEKAENSLKKILPTNTETHDHNDNRPMIGLVILGETGAGKSTFLQALKDHAASTPFENVEETIRDPNIKKTESQTKLTRRHSFVSNDYVLKVIDTPGIGDTVGIDEDRRHIDNITKFLSDDCDFNAICVIIKNGQNRATSRMAYIINELKTNLTTDVWSHVFTIVTRCPPNRFPGDDTCAVIEKFGLPGPLEEDRFFLVDNYAYERVDARHRPKMYVDAKKRAYDEANEQLGLIIDAARSLPMKNGKRIGQLRLHRQELKVYVKDYQHEIQNNRAKEKALKETKAKVERCQSDAELHKNFESTHIITKFRKKFYENDGKATICLTCDNRCHDPCYLRVVGDVTGCAAFGLFSCNECGHPHESHKHSRFYYEQYDAEEPVVNEEVKKQFEKATSAADKARILCTSIEGELKQIEENIEELMGKIANVCVEIDTMAVECFNDFFPDYVEELKADVMNMKLEPEDKLIRIQDYDRQVAQYREIKKMYEARAFGRSKVPAN